jgi:hypothetical protein
VVTEWAKDDLDRMAGAYYMALHINDCSTPWHQLEDWQRHKHRRAARALMEAHEAMVTEQMAAFRASRRRTVRLERAG